MNRLLRQTDNAVYALIRKEYLRQNVLEFRHLK